MANYVASSVFIKGTKKAVVDFLNKGLKNNKSYKRLNVKMMGADMVSLLNTMDIPLEVQSYIPMPKTYKVWDTTSGPKSFYIWYEEGCVSNQDNLGDPLWKERNEEVYSYMMAHKDEYTLIIPKENDPLYKEPYFSYADYDRATAILHPELVAQYRKYVRGYRRAVAYQKKKYGLVGWLEWCEKKYGCIPYIFQNWQVVRESNEQLCLQFTLETQGGAPIAALEKINDYEGVTIYAFGVADADEFAYAYNGATKKEEWVEPEKEAQYETYRKEFEYKNGITEEAAAELAAEKIINQSLARFQKEFGIIYSTEINITHGQLHR